MHKVLCSLAVAGLLLALAPQVHAAVVVDAAYWTGTRTAQAGGGITAPPPPGEWGGTTAANILQLSYSVTQSGSLYTYSYTLSGLGGVALHKAVSHSIFETSTTFTAANLKAGSSGSASIGWQDDGTGSNNPGLPVHSIYGVYFDTGGYIATYTIVTDRAPVWGDFYSKDGNNNPNYAWNTGFGTDPLANGPFTNWIATPDSTDGGGGGGQGAPLPAAVWGGIALLSGLGALKSLRRKPA